VEHTKKNHIILKLNSNLLSNQSLEERIEELRGVGWVGWVVSNVMKKKVSINFNSVGLHISKQTFVCCVWTTAPTIIITAVQFANEMWNKVN